MALLRPLARGVRTLFRSRDADHDVDDELRQYIDHAVADGMSRGLTLAQATRVARREVGNVVAAREQVRASGWEHAVETLVRDLRYAIRGLGNAPVFTLTAVLTIALGVGASTAVFSAVSPILIEPLPFPDAGRLVAISDRSNSGGVASPTLGSFDEIRTRSRDFTALAATDRWQPSLIGTGDPERLDGERVTAGYFAIFGAVPLFGRTFTAAEDRVGGPRVVVLGNGLWQRRFGGDRSIVGRTIELNGIPYVVIGIMSNSFTNVLAPGAQLWSPMQEEATGDFNSRAWGHHYQIVGRIAAGVPLAQANRELATVAHQAVGSFPRPEWANMDPPLAATPLQDQVTAAVRPALFAIAGAVLLLLLIAAVNVTNLLLARAARRQSEFAMRLALGAGRSRLLRQLLTESLVLALLGGLLGLGVAEVGLHALVTALPGDVPGAGAIRVDIRAFVFALGLTSAIGVVVGLAGAARTLRSDLSEGLRPGTRRATVGRDSARGMLVVAEMALALMLVVGAGLVLRSVRRLVAVPPGFVAPHLLTMQVLTVGHEFPSDTARLAFLEQTVDLLRHLPGVTSAGYTSQLPLSGELDAYGSEWQSLPDTRHGLGGDVLRYAVSPGYFATMRIPLVAGRGLDANDRGGASRSIVINQGLARRLFGIRDPIGERVRFGPEMQDSVPWGTVVGVVGDVRQSLLSRDAPDAFYVTQGQWSWFDNANSLVVRTDADAAALAPAIKRAIWSIDPNVPIQRVESMSTLVEASAGQRRFVLLAIEAFASTALVLAAIGLYGVMSGIVSERVREIGIRTALGATSGAIVANFARRAFTVTAAGGVIGCLGALAASRLLASLLFGVSRADPLTYVGALAVLSVVAVVAVAGPVRRAMRVDPVVALRAE